jgi:acetyltransferase-like isoleucine patch superfamily enzyme
MVQRKKISARARKENKGRHRNRWNDAWKLQLQNHGILWELHQTLRKQIRKRWSRGLPFNEELFDRWERASFFGFGKGSSIYDSGVILGDVRVGENTWIGPFTVLDGSGGLEIGSYCSVSSGVHIYSHDTVKWALSGGNSDYEHAPVKIGNCCYIGSFTVITKGVTVGDHCVVGACSFVNRDIPPYTVAFGTPCRPVGRVGIDDHGNVTVKLPK